jgi:hypothetical protein
MPNRSQQYARRIARTFVSFGRCGTSHRTIQYMFIHLIMHITSPCAHILHTQTGSVKRAGRSTPQIPQMASQLNRLLVLELSPRPICRAEAELIPVQLELDVWDIEYRFRVSRVTAASAAGICSRVCHRTTSSRGRSSTIKRDGERKDRPLLW